MKTYSVEVDQIKGIKLGDGITVYSGTYTVEANSIVDAKFKLMEIGARSFNRITELTKAVA